MISTVRESKRNWDVVAKENALQFFEDHFDVGISIDCCPSGYVSVCHNRPYPMCPDLRDQELTFIRKTLAAAGIEELAYTTFPEPGHRVAGITYALILDAGEEQLDFITEVVEQAVRRSQEMIVRGRIQLRSLDQANADGLWPAGEDTDSSRYAAAADVLTSLPEDIYSDLKNLGVTWSIPDGGSPTQVGPNVIHLPAELEDEFWEVPFAVVPYHICCLMKPDAGHEEIMATISAWGYRDEADILQRKLDEGWPDWAIQVLRSDPRPLCTRPQATWRRVFKKEPAM